MLTAITGVNWGDEGKGRMVDLLSEHYDIICRYQGGNNAGHTVINEKGSFVLNLLPSGVFREGVTNVIGNGMVIDLEHLACEITSLAKQGVLLTPQTLKISSKACICLPYHITQDILEEERLAGEKYGSTRRGIAPAYGDKYMKKVVRMEDLFDLQTLEQKVTGLVPWKNITLKGYQAPEVEVSDVLHWLTTHGELTRDFVTDTTEYLSGALSEGKNILFEAQLGALRDIDFGIYPYTTSSQTLAAYAPLGAGIPQARLDHVIGVIKAYSSCVGEGPFTAELFGEQAHALREAGSEYGAATRRPRRVGGFDVVASRYGTRMQGADELVLTKLDVLSYLETIPVCVAYEIEGKQCDYFPSGDNLLKAKPIYEYLEGFKRDISACRSMHDLPKEAVEYIRFIEKVVACPITYVSVGPERDDYLTMR